MTDISKVPPYCISGSYVFPTLHISATCRRHVGRQDICLSIGKVVNNPPTTTDCEDISTTKSASDAQYSRARYNTSAQRYVPTNQQPTARNARPPARRQHGKNHSKNNDDPVVLAASSRDRPPKRLSLWFLTAHLNNTLDRETDGRSVSCRPFEAGEGVFSSSAIISENGICCF